MRWIDGESLAHRLANGPGLSPRKAAELLRDVANAIHYAHDRGILQAMESLEALTAEMDPAMAEKVTDAVTLVYESCNFQDITGQRITKVVKALKHIESKVDALVAAFGDEIAKYKSAHPTPEKAEDPMSDKALLNGPQLAANAGKQDDIDALLASFD